MRLIDLEQLGYWFDNCRAELLLYARSWLDSAPAEDVVQDAFIRLMAQRTPPRNIRPWLFRCVRNAAISQFRRRQRRKKHHQKIATSRQNWFEPHPSDLIDAQTAQAVLESLPADQREVVVLRIWSQMSFKEIAEITANPISTIHSRYRKALEEIKKKMEFVICKTKKT